MTASSTPTTEPAKIYFDQRPMSGDPLARWRTAIFYGLPWFEVASALGADQDESFENAKEIAEAALGVWLAQCDGPVGAERVEAWEIAFASTRLPPFPSALVSKPGCDYAREELTKLLTELRALRRG